MSIYINGSQNRYFDHEFPNLGKDGRYLAWMDLAYARFSLVPRAESVVFHAIFNTRRNFACFK